MVKLSVVPTGWVEHHRPVVSGFFAGTILLERKTGQTTTDPDTKKQTPAGPPRKRGSACRSAGGCEGGLSDRRRSSLPHRPIRSYRSSYRGLRRLILM